MFVSSAETPGGNGRRGAHVEAAVFRATLLDATLAVMIRDPDDEWLTSALKNDRERIAAEAIGWARARLQGWPMPLTQN